MEDKRHHSKYLSEQDVIHKCLITYMDVLSNMPFSWYVDRVHESVGRKMGVRVGRELVQTTLAHFLRGKIDFCPHCYK
jgi:hypothetical protein